MVAIAYTDLPNGIIIVLACLLAVPFVYVAAGGLPAGQAGPRSRLFLRRQQPVRRPPVAEGLRLFPLDDVPAPGRAEHVPEVLQRQVGQGRQESRVVWWTIGTIFVETVVVVIAVFAYSKLQGQIDLSVPKAGGKVVLMAARSLVPAPVGVLLLGAACAVVISTGMNYLLSPSTTHHARHLPAVHEKGRQPRRTWSPSRRSSSSSSASSPFSWPPS